MPVDSIAAKVITRASLPTAGAQAGASNAGAPGDTFGATLGRLVKGVEHTGAAANEAVDGMLAGTVDVHDAMIALQKADHTFQFSVQVRNKLMNAYQEIMRMPV